MVAAAIFFPYSGIPLSGGKVKSGVEEGWSAAPVVAGGQLRGSGAPFTSEFTC